MSAGAPRRPFSRFAERVVGDLLFRKVPIQPSLVARMRSEAAALERVPVTASDLWNGFRRQLTEDLQTGDPAAFLRWPAVRRTMVKRSHRRVLPELRHLQSRPDWRHRWRPVIRETTLGGLRPYPRHPWSSANVIFQAYHLCRFEEATGRRLETLPTIVEFGGGYGRLCHLIHDLGFSGAYVIFDLPEVGVLQRLYLRHVGLAVRDTGNAAWGRGVLTVNDPSRLRAVLTTRRPGEAAFVAVGSLSEVPLALRDAILAEVASFDAFLIFYGEWEDASIDNHAYFGAWRAAHPEHAWQTAAIPHMEKHAWYLFGRRP